MPRGLTCLTETAGYAIRCNNVRTLSISLYLQDPFAGNSTLLRSGDPAAFAYEKRPCNKLSTGAILLADILPALSIKLVASFLPLWKQ